MYIIVINLVVWFIAAILANFCEPFDKFVFGFSWFCFGTWVAFLADELINRKFIKEIREKQLDNPD